VLGAGIGLLRGPGANPGTKHGRHREPLGVAIPTVSGRRTTEGAFGAGYVAAQMLHARSRVRPAAGLPRPDGLAMTMVASRRQAGACTEALRTKQRRHREPLGVAIPTVSERCTTEGAFSAGYVAARTRRVRSRVRPAAGLPRPNGLAMTMGVRGVGRVRSRVRGPPPDCHALARGQFQYQTTPSSRALGAWRSPPSRSDALPKGPLAQATWRLGHFEHDGVRAARRPVRDQM